MSSFIPNLDHLGFFEQSLGLFGDTYSWNYTYVSPLAMAQGVPSSSLPKFEWGLAVGKKVLAVLANSVAVDASASVKSALQSKLDSLQQSVDQGNIDFSALSSVVSDVAAYGRLTTGSGERPKSIDDYANLFQAIGLPAVSCDFNQDSTFAEMRTAGPNPLLIELMSAPMDNFPVTESQFQRVMTGDSLEAAMKEHRLYKCDYKALSVLAQNTDEPVKHLYAPIALFAEHKFTGALIPVAIQTQQTKGSSIYIADGSYDWLIAKTIVEMADGNYHEAVSHLGRTHLFIEPFVVATARQLQGHAVYKLLWPHFEGTVFINWAAVNFLINKGGGVEQLLDGSLDSILQMTVNGIQDYPFSSEYLPKTFAARGVENLKQYSYRDDSLLYWNAIQKWVSDYLSVAYVPPAGGIPADQQIQNWYRDLVSQNGGRVKGFAPINTIGDLTDALTMIIYTASVQHAAVNFPQYDLMSYTPNMPLASYANFSSGSGAQQYLDILPPIERAKLQQTVGFVLGSVHYTQLGDYGIDYFDPSIASGPLANFQQSLVNVGGTIQTRNTNRRPYNTLAPAGIPQSINI